jgi:DNA-binding NarL/FixJ family response regulator
MVAFDDGRGVRDLSNDEEEIIRVAVVDDQRLFAKGISGLVDMVPGVEVVGVAHDGEEGVALCREEEPDVVLMDISMPKMASAPHARSRTFCRRPPSSSSPAMRKTRTSSRASRLEHRATC